MAIIKPFTGYLPSESWLSDMLEQGNQNPNHIASDPLKSIQSLLEPNPQGTKGLQSGKNRESMQTLLNNRSYNQAAGPALYLYEQESYQGSQFGIWAQTSLDDYIGEMVIPHEQTLDQQLDKLKAYRTVVGLEGKPILLTYERNAKISSLIEKIASTIPMYNFCYQQLEHRLWSITDQRTIVALQKAFAGVKKAYIADGHHRLAAAALQHKQKPQWISTLYITTGQVRCREFNRSISPAKPIDHQSFLEHLHKYGFTTSLPRNTALRPDAEKRFGIFFQGIWYQYDLKLEYRKDDVPDVCFLQDKIFKSFFGIENPKTDGRLICWPAAQWDQMIDYSQQHSDVLIFSCKAMSAQQLMQVADSKTSLPPKSTYMEPKLPYGLVICDHQLPGNQITESANNLNRKFKLSPSKSI